MLQDVDDVLCLDANASIRLRNAGLNVLGAIDRYDAPAQMKAVKFADRATDEIAKSCARIGFDSLDFGQAIKADVYPLTASIAKLWTVLGEGPWLALLRGEYEVFEDKALLCRAIGPALVDRSFMHSQPRATRSETALVTLNKQIAKLAHRKNAVLLNEDRLGFASAIELLKVKKSADRIIVCRPAVGSLRDHFAVLAAAAKAMVGLGPWEIRLYRRPALDKEELKSMELALKTTSDCRLRAFLPEISDLLNSVLSAVRLYRQQLDVILARSAPRAFVAYHMREPLSIAASAVCGDSGVTRVLVSHGTHTVHDQPEMDSAAKVNAEGMLFGPFVDVALCQSPLALTAVKKWMPTLPCRRIRPIVWGAHGARRNIERRSGPFTILHAGTFKDWPNSRPMLFETGEEYAYGIRKLADAVIRMQDVRLVVRVRESERLSIANLRRLLPDSRQIMVTTGGSFLADMKESDLLVSHCSTTIEEALDFGLPVLLWGGSASGYFHIPSGAEPPLDGGQEAIYRVENANDLLPMLSGIEKAHRSISSAGQKHLDTSFERFTWDKSLNGLSEFVDWLAGGDCEDWGVGDNDPTSPSSLAQSASQKGMEV